jgi:hypothetical protein
LNVCREQDRLRGRQQSPHDGALREGPSYVDDALGWISGASQQAEWLGSHPGRDNSARSETEREPQPIKPQVTLMIQGMGYIVLAYILRCATWRPECTETLVQ